MAWIVNGTTLDIGADEDTGWMPEVVMAEQHPPNAIFSIIQYGGQRSARRICSGVTKSSSVKAAIEACRGVVVNITDHHGVTSSVFVQDIEWKEIKDISNLAVGTFRWTMKLIRR